MSEIKEEILEVAKPEAKKRGRKPKVQATGPSPAPIDSPTIRAFEEEVLALVRSRGLITGSLNTAKVESETANVRLRAAQEQLIQVEREVQYRLALIQQLRGGGQQSQLSPQTYAPTPVPSYPDSADYGYAPVVGVPAGVGSIASHSGPVPISSFGGQKIRSESADNIRAEMASRAI